MSTKSGAMMMGASKERMRTLNFSQQLADLFECAPFIAPKASFWHYFQSDAKQWAESGETSRFEKSDGSDYLLDKKTGDLWPARVVEMLSRYSVFD